MMTDFLKYPLLVKVNFVILSGLVIDDDADGVRLHFWTAAIMGLLFIPP
jgi:hypothetical protein